MKKKHFTEEADNQSYQRALIIESYKTGKRKKSAL